MERITPKPGQESVWDYPRPPRVEDESRHVRVVFNGAVVADTNRAKRVLETSHPPVYYIPPEDCKQEFLHLTQQTTYCEFKGRAQYYTVRVGEEEAPESAWFYPGPVKGYEALKDHVAFYPGKMSECYVGDERVQSQEGDFYGGWITKDIVGPFKGGIGTRGW